MSSTEDKIVNFISTLISALIVDLVMAWIVMLLWNGILPIVLSLPAVTYWQSFGIMLLAEILFKSNIRIDK